MGAKTTARLSRMMHSDGRLSTSQFRYIDRITIYLAHASHPPLCLATMAGCSANSSRVTPPNCSPITLPLHASSRPLSPDLLLAVHLPVSPQYRHELPLSRFDKEQPNAELESPCFAVEPGVSNTIGKCLARRGPRSKVSFFSSGCSSTQAARNAEHNAIDLAGEKVQAAHLRLPPAALAGRLL